MGFSKCWSKLVMLLTASSYLIVPRFMMFFMWESSKSFMVSLPRKFSSCLP
uniref:Uncharacterized protein n=1 Tax=Arundo donax TaxID=35708 RepID=A0A0A8ZS06_ARUDO